jgi:methylglutaconyl-CoA hydratase
MQNYQSISVQLADKQANIWLNRPEKHNALNPLMIAELTEAFSRFSADTDIRLIVLRGKGKSFCAGADLNYMKEIAGFGEEENHADAMKLAMLFETIYSSPKPVIALVHGSVYGGANGLSAACDIVLAEKIPYLPLVK